MLLGLLTPLVRAEGKPVCKKEAPLVCFVRTDVPLMRMPDVGRGGGRAATGVIVPFGLGQAELPFDVEVEETFLHDLVPLSHAACSPHAQGLGRKLDCPLHGQCDM